jgi:CRISPR type I-E/ECOLI-associated protein CasA/Cse1
MNLLLNPLFRVQTPTGLKRMNLPQLLEALSADRVESLPGLQRHQEDAFHIFLCYLAGAVLAREGRADAVQDESFWRDGIRRLTDQGDDCAWTLVVEDVTKPAFMQAPLPSKQYFTKFNPKEPKAVTPDELDILQTAKNHDVKTKRTVKVEPEHWVYALVSLQTMTGQMGRGNYGIARMNSGTGSRVCVGLIYDERPGGRWARDTQKLLTHCAELLSGPWGYRTDGWVLTWLPAWNLKTSLPLSELHPFFIEIARSVRLVLQGGEIRALGAASEGNRIAAKELKGVLGDPWTPIVTPDTKAWTVTAPYFSPKRLRDLLFEDGFTAPLMQHPDTEQANVACYLKASVLAPGGMGKTDGFHEAVIRIPAKATASLFRRGPAHDHLANLSKTGLNDAGQMQNKVLKPALFSLLEAGPEKIDFDKREVGDWVNHAIRRFGDAWADDFFPWLWHTIDQPDANAARRKWLNTLREKAWRVLQEAIVRFPERNNRRYRARVCAAGLFYGSLYKVFPDLKEDHHASRTG